MNIFKWLGRRGLPCAGILLVVTSAIGSTVAAQTYPTKPIRLVVPFPAGERPTSLRDRSRNS